MAPILAEHIGSLQRPRPLLDEIHRIYEVGHTALLPEERAKDRSRLHELEDEAIRRVVATQEDIGLPLVTDGEFRLSSMPSTVSGRVAPSWSSGATTAASSSMRVRSRSAAVSARSTAPRRGRRRLSPA